MNQLSWHPSRNLGRYIVVPAAINAIGLRLYTQAQAYNEGAYNSALYAGTGVTPEPPVTVPVPGLGTVTLPITGSQLSIILGAALVAAGVGWWMWRRERRRATLLQP